jgi:alanine dehydrogenase
VTTAKTRILVRSELDGLLSMGEVVDAVEAGFAAHGRGQARMPAKVYLDLPEHDGDFRAMPSLLGERAGVKWVNSHPKNPERHGLPSVMGLYVLSDPATALPLAVMDATWLTAVRTGAAGAVASRHLARSRPRTIGFVGCGVQARTLLAAHRAVFEGLEVFGADVFAEAAARFAEEVGGRAVTLREACAADIVCTSTPVRTPVVQDGWIGDGTHIDAMGADGPGKQELDARILRRARLFIDDLEQATHSGEVNVPLHDGALTVGQIAGTLGQVVAGAIEGRTRDQDITVFDSTGLAIQDLAVAEALLEAAEAKGVGTLVDFRA